MKRRTRFICIVVAICLVAAIAVILVCWCNSRQTFSWSMHGTWVTDEGPTNETLPFSLNGTIIEPRGDDFYRVEIASNFADDFPYGIDSPNSGDMGLLQAQWGYFTVNAMSFNSNTGFMDSFSYALDLNKEYAIFYWEDSDHYFVASADPNAKPEDIVAHFKEFIEHYVHK